MESRLFSDVLRAAVSGDPDSVEAIVASYMPLISSWSVNGEVFDEDMRQYILLRVITQIPRYDPERAK